MSRSGASSLKEVRLQKEMDKVLAEKEAVRMELEVAPPSRAATSRHSMCLCDLTFSLLPASNNLSIHSFFGADHELN